LLRLATPLVLIQVGASRLVLQRERHGGTVRGCAA
jgi:hypothetical protein